MLQRSLRSFAPSRIPATAAAKFFVHRCHRRRHRRLLSDPMRSSCSGAGAGTSVIVAVGASSRRAIAADSSAVRTNTAGDLARGFTRGSDRGFARNAGGGGGAAPGSATSHGAAARTEGRGGAYDEIDGSAIDVIDKRIDGAGTGEEESAGNSDADADAEEVEGSGSPGRSRVRVIPLGGGISHVVLSRPGKLNALDMGMFEAIAETAAKLKEDRSLRAVILSGEGRAFCTGLDVKAIALSNPKRSLDRLMERPSGYARQSDGRSTSSSATSSIAGIGNLAQDCAYLWRNLPVPVIAVLHGMCFGGGTQIALGADFRIASPDCRISVMESRWGLIPDMSASVTLRELVRIDVAKDLAMTGRIISGREAKQIGLVTQCADDPMKEARKLAEEIVERSPDSVAATKELFQRTWVADEKTCLEVETNLQTKLIGTWNQIAATGRQFGVRFPYFRRKD